MYRSVYLSVGTFFSRTVAVVDTKRGYVQWEFSTARVWSHIVKEKHVSWLQNINHLSVQCVFLLMVAVVNAKRGYVCRYNGGLAQ